MAAQILRLATCCATLLASTASVEAADAPTKSPLVERMNVFDVGVFVGGFFPSGPHELYDPNVTTQKRLKPASFEGGLRLGYWPLRIAFLETGLELEGAVVPTSVKRGGGALVTAFRGHLALQCPMGAITPFAVGGLGALGIFSADTVNGNDQDLAWHWGLGAKYGIGEALSIRLDARQIIAPKLQSYKRLTDHYELLLGASWSFGKAKAAAATPPSEKAEPAKPAVKGDRDGDGILDKDDACPDQPEDKDGFEDNDGCPDPDNDKDGIPDVSDKCPNEAGPLSNGGCPIHDRDGDGIQDEVDKCPDQPEDKDGFQDDDGCPDPDNDNDGVIDGRDACPNEAGPAENNGCPDVDSDKDGVVDRLDNCPNEAGLAEFFGCKTKQLVKLTADKIEILEKIFFATGKDVIEERSFGLLDNIVAVLKSHPNIKLVRIEGHTDDVGKAEMNRKLSQKRADSVVRYLLERGIAPARVTAVGFGPDRPIAPNKTERGRAQNRRVEFNIVSDADEAAKP